MWRTYGGLTKKLTKEFWMAIVLLNESPNVKLGIPLCMITTGTCVCIGGRKYLPFCAKYGLPYWKDLFFQCDLPA